MCRAESFGESEYCSTHIFRASIATVMRYGARDLSPKKNTSVSRHGAFNRRTRLSGFCMDRECGSDPGGSQRQSKGGGPSSFAAAAVTDVTVTNDLSTTLQQSRAASVSGIELLSASQSTNDKCYRTRECGASCGLRNA